MAAYNAPWDLRTAGRSQDYRPVGSGGRGPAMPDSQNWVNAVVASSNRAAAQNTAATSAGATIGAAGIGAIAGLGKEALGSQAGLAAAGMNAAGSAYNHKTTADAAVKREKVARGSDTMGYLKLAGGLGLLAYGITQT